MCSEHAPPFAGCVTADCVAQTPAGPPLSSFDDQVPVVQSGCTEIAHCPHAHAPAPAIGSATRSFASSPAGHAVARSGAKATTDQLASGAVGPHAHGRSVGPESAPVPPPESAPASPVAGSVLSPHPSGDVHAFGSGIVAGLQFPPTHVSVAPHATPLHDDERKIGSVSRVCGM